MNKQELDLVFGEPRFPDQIRSWEKDRAPRSLTKFDLSAANLLAKLRDCAQSNLFSFSLRTQNFLWAMTEDGAIVLAVEEMAAFDDEPSHVGYPRRRGLTHPSDEKKLGHPTLVGGGMVRIAGELVLDESTQGVAWILNAASGRYCRLKPPLDSQIDAIAAVFRERGVEMTVDYL